MIMYDVERDISLQAIKLAVCDEVQSWWRECVIPVRKEVTKSSLLKKCWTVSEHVVGL